jgi:predicted Rossmann-fold nucleotide-binding protein
MSEPSKPLRLLVCGGRDYVDRDAVWRALDKLNAVRGVACVIQGGAAGADRLAYEWATEREVQVEHFPANWTLYGRAAGPIRNRQMIADGRPDGVVAFPGGRGTADMICAATEAGLKVWKP